MRGGDGEEKQARGREGMVRADMTPLVRAGMVRGRHDSTNESRHGERQT